MNVFELSDYRVLLKVRVDAVRSDRAGFTLDFIAGKTRIQKSHLSRVLNGRAHLSAEQLHLVATLCQLPRDELAFAQALLSQQRASSRTYADHAAAAVTALRQRHSGASGSIEASAVEASSGDLARYYANVLVPVVHMYLCLPAFASRLDRLEKRLSIDAATLSSLIDELESLRLVERTPKSPRVLRDSVHLPAQSPLAQTHQLNLRLAACAAMQRDWARKGLHFSASFTCDGPGITTIRQRFYQFLEEAQAISNASGEQGADVFHINFDLFQLA